MQKTQTSRPSGKETLMPVDEFRRWSGLGQEAILLAASGVAVHPPMVTPAEAWGLILTDLHLTEADPTEPVAPFLFVGVWEPEPIPSDEVEPGEVAVLLASAEDTGFAAVVNVRMLFAAPAGWQLIGRWDSLGLNWPEMIAPTAHAAMSVQLQLPSDVR